MGSLKITSKLWSLYLFACIGCIDMWAEKGCIGKCMDLKNGYK